MQAFLVRERYSGGQHPTALMAKLRSAPRGRVGELELAARRRLVLRFVAMIRTLNAQIKDLEREIRTAGPRAPGRSDLPLAVQIAGERDHRRGAARGDRRLSRALPRPRRARRRRRPSRRRRWSPANGRPPASDERATSGCASRSAGWRTSSRHWHPWAQTSTPKPASAATSTPARSAPSDAPGAASCGNAGATTPHTTPRDTARCNATSPSPSPARRAQCPTSLPPSGWPAPLSPNGRPARAEREALDSKPPSATHGRLTQDVFGDVRIAGSNVACADGMILRVIDWAYERRRIGASATSPGFARNPRRASASDFGAQHLGQPALARAGAVAVDRHPPH